MAAAHGPAAVLPSGTVTGAFWLRVEKASGLDLEWRDNKSGSPYRVGARLRMQDGKLRLDGGKTLDLPMGQRVRDVIAGTLGVEEGRWSRAVSLAGRETKNFSDLACRRKGFRQLTWFGLMSGANAAAASCVDGAALSVK